jgi:hypothetical protein
MSNQPGDPESEGMQTERSTDAAGWALAVMCLLSGSALFWSESFLDRAQIIKDWNLTESAWNDPSILTGRALLRTAEMMSSILHIAVGEALGLLCFAPFVLLGALGVWAFAQKTRGNSSSIGKNSVS